MAVKSGAKTRGGKGGEGEEKEMVASAWGANSSMFSAGKGKKKGGKGERQGTWRPKFV